jgi:cytochrome c oxidase subunit 2
MKLSLSKGLSVMMSSSGLLSLGLPWSGLFGSGLSLSLLLFPLTAGDPVAGKQRYAACMACHGMNGEGNVSMKAPPLIGLEGWYIKTQLKNFKEGVRGANPKDLTGLQMKAMAMTLPDEKAVDDLIAYVKTLGTKKGEVTLGGNPDAGKMKYMTCVACHGADGGGNAALKSPSLKGLPDWYIVAQLKKFKEGIRGAHPADTQGKMMAPMAKMLATEQEMKDVAAYILSLQK